MRFVEMIQAKRDGGALRRQEIEDLVQGYVRGEVPDYQVAAFAMAVYFRGMTAPETLALTEAMMHSGSVLEHPDLPGAIADKHATGGVGDKTSLVVAPLAAACGVYIPMIAGRGMAHTGGTLDRLDSIPGFDTQLPLARFRDVLRDVGVAITGQTPEIAPVDRKLYALRDVTATVESHPLIAASIMSRKMAEGLDALVLDVKTGEGAFMEGIEDARALARTMLEIGQGMGKKVAALITDMSQPLGRQIGNALEVEEAIATLKGRGPKDVESLSIELASWMLYLAATPTLDQARSRVRAVLSSGAGLRKLQTLIEHQGGDPRVCDDTRRLPRAQETHVIPSPGDGRVGQIGCRAIGRGAMRLGAGRATVDSRIDPAVGVVLHKKVGELVVQGEPLMTIHYNDRTKLEHALPLFEGAYRLVLEAPPLTPLIRDMLQ
jgi:pyrimidine-nucleoside phosphorylase/thymidine phosphorylase